jgi:hypothetical protein
MVFNANSGSLEKVKKGKVYNFNTYSEKAKPNQPKRIFWDVDYGIIKYITHDDITWRRIKF